VAYADLKKEAMAAEAIEDPASRHEAAGSLLEVWPSPRHAHCLITTNLTITLRLLSWASQRLKPLLPKVAADSNATSVEAGLDAVLALLQAQSVDDPRRLADALGSVKDALVTSCLDKGK
jgi:hypothetical protein